MTDKLNNKAANTGAKIEDKVTETPVSTPVETPVKIPSRNCKITNLDTFETPVATPVKTPIETPIETLDESKLSEIDQIAFDKNEASFGQRAQDAGIGLIRTFEQDFTYVGVSPGLDPSAVTPSGAKITSANSTFTPLADLRFDISLRIKDTETGEYYFPTDAVSFETTALNGNPLIPVKPNQAYRAARLKARIAI